MADPHKALRAAITQALSLSSGLPGVRSALVEASMRVPAYAPARPLVDVPDWVPIDVRLVRVDHEHEDVLADITAARKDGAEFCLPDGATARDACGSPYVLGIRTSRALEVVERFRAGEVLAALARRSGLPAHHARNILEVHGLLADRVSARNREMRARHAAGWAQSDIADAFRLTRGRVQQIVGYT